MTDVAAYTSLITSEHADKPNFVASVAASVQPFVDVLSTLNALPAAFDIDLAVGRQLDIIGQWIGVTRYVSSPLAGVYFAFDDIDLGWDQGVWWAPGDPLTGLESLPDDIYVLLLRAKIVANQWDGTIPGAYTAWDVLFSPSGLQILIQDNGDMTMDLALTGATNNAVFVNLFAAGYLNLRPAGVRIASFLFPSLPGPIFGFDAENGSISGWDSGAWSTISPAESTALLVGGGVLILGSTIIRVAF